MLRDALSVEPLGIAVTVSVCYLPLSRINCYLIPENVAVFSAVEVHRVPMSPL